MHIQSKVASEALNRGDAAGPAVLDAQGPRARAVEGLDGAGGGAGQGKHLRRKFYDAAAITKNVVAREGLYRIHRVFKNEERFRKLAPEQRKQLRSTTSRPRDRAARS